MGALVPGARVVLTDAATHSSRTTTSNGEGFFYFAAVTPATYTVTVSEKGFETWTVTGVMVHPGDDLTVSKLNLKPGAIAESVVVTADVAGVQLNSGEHSTMITAGQIQRLSTVGRDATELVSMLPGFTYNAGANIQNQGPDYQTMGFGSGAIGAYGASGSAPQQGLVNITSDGANVIDPGDMGGQISNINMDQVQEVKVQTADFGADQAKGPVVINAVGKSGGSDFHGGLYSYFRNYALNSNDWISKYLGLARAQRKYLYPGGSLGGPVEIPGTNFNHSKKLVFWAGYEYYGQQDVNGLAEAFVPTQAMLAGDFSRDSIAQALNLSATDLANNCSASYSQTAAYTNVGGLCAVPSGSDVQGNPITNGRIPTADLDPGVATFTRLYPKINRVPQPVVAGGETIQASDGFNYVQNVLSTHNGFQFHGRLDENISDNLKLYATYNWEKVNDQAPLQNIYYIPGGTVPYPTSLYSNANAQYLTLDATRSFSSSLTNELAVSGVYFNEPEQFGNPAAAQVTGTAWANAGYTGGLTGALLGEPNKAGTTQLPRIGGYESVNVPSFSMGYVPSGSQFLRKFSWNLTDTVTKVLKTHSIKMGFYAEQTGNNQITLGSQVNGTLQFMRWDSCYPDQALPGPGQTPQQPSNPMSLGNEVANFMSGCPLSYSQDLGDPNVNLRFTTLEGFATDEWKVIPKLTLTLGVRLSHIGPWTDVHGVGMAVWEPSELQPGVVLGTVTSDNSTWKGFEWHQKDHSIPVAGVPTRLLFYSPRFGVAYDVYGNGKTVLRGGWGAYRAHDNTFAAGAVNTSIGLRTWNIPGNTSCTFGQLFTNTYVPCGYYYKGSTGSVTPFGVSALDKSDDRVPLTYNYNFTIDQVIPWKATFEVAYVGNQASDLVTLGNLQNQNVIPLGAFFGPDPVTGQINPASNIPNAADYRPYPNYQQISVPNHIAWSNYNSLQASLNRQTGGLVYGVNYTFSKALGVRGNWDTGAIGDPVNLHNDYGIVSFDRRHVLNANYSWQEGVKLHGNRILKGAANGWELSGIMSLQSGPDLSVLTSTNYNFGGGANYSTTGGSSTSTVSIPISASTWLGTSDYSLQPTVRCDPSAGLKKDQFVNGACFGLPAQGSQGMWNLPYVMGPAYFKWDMSVYKDFQISERQNIQLRLAGFNFLNHPLTSFYAGNLTNLSLVAGDPVGSQYTTPEQALDGVTISNASTFATTNYKMGQRIVELGFKYNF